MNANVTTLLINSKELSWVTHTLIGEQCWVAFPRAVPLLFLIYVNDMPLQVRNGILVQFADDTSLICYGDDHSSVSQMLCEDLCSLHLWVRDSRMSFNVNK